MGIILASRMGVLRKVEAKRVLPGTTSGPNSVEVQKMGRQLASARERVKLVREGKWPARSEEHTSELQSLMRLSYAVFCLKKKHTTKDTYNIEHRVPSQNKSYSET